jgi:NAD-dependent SIR2 family protein deacetylase
MSLYPDPPAGALGALADFIVRHPAVLVLTGAGISIASGIPGYRDHAGVRQASAPIQGPQFRQHEALRRRYWARSMFGYALLAQAHPMNRMRWRTSTRRYAANAAARSSPMWCFLATASHPTAPLRRPGASIRPTRCWSLARR